MTLPVEKPQPLDVYADLDVATAIWTIDIPQLHIIGARAGGHRDNALAAVLAQEGHCFEMYKPRYHDLAGYDLDYEG